MKRNNQKFLMQYDKTKSFAFPPEIQQDQDIDGNAILIK